MNPATEPAGHDDEAARDLDFGTSDVGPGKADSEAGDTERRRAQDNLRLALEALDGILIRTGEASLPRAPERNREDQELLKKALEFYEGFIQRNRNEPLVRRETAKAYHHVGEIQYRLKQHRQAEEAFRRAIALSEKLAEEFPDRRLFADLHGHTPGRDPVVPLDALAGLLAAIGVEPRSVPPDVEGRSAMWRDRMAGQRALVVLDNAASSEQVTPLLPGTPGCLVLVTSRRHLADRRYPAPAGQQRQPGRRHLPPPVRQLQRGRRPLAPVKQQTLVRAQLAVRRWQRKLPNL